MNPTLGNTPTTLAIVVSACVVLASAYLVYAMPERPWPYLLAIAFVGFAWLARYFGPRDAAPLDGEPASPSAQSELTRAIVRSGILLALPLGIALIAQTDWLAGLAAELRARSFGVLLGAIVALFANVIPKNVSPARGLPMRRTMGRALLLGGVGYAVAWLVLPLNYANDGALVALLLGAAYASVRLTWHRVSRRTSARV
jgi:hypothetical protein